MKNFCLTLLAFALVPAAAFAQALPDDPVPAQAKAPPIVQAPASPAQPTQPPSQPSVNLTNAAWTRIQQIARGQEVLVTNTYGPPLRCRFAGATEAYLFCDPPGTPEGTGYRFERATVLNVKVVRPPHNWHPGLLSAMIGGGIITGLCATAQTDAGHATEAGLVGALIAGAIASPFVFLPQPMYGGFGAGLAFRPHGFSHRPHMLFPIRR